jgi:hypothetical protein
MWKLFEVQLPVSLARVVAIVRPGDGVMAATLELPPPTPRAAATACEIAAQLIRLPVRGGGALPRDGDATVMLRSSDVAGLAHGDDRIAGGFQRR